MAIDLAANKNTASFDIWLANILANCECNRQLDDNEQLYLKNRYNSGAKVKSIWI